MTAPDPAALLAAMEAAAQKARQSDCAFAYISVSDLATLCAALRASQEREAAAVAAEREACAALADAQAVELSPYSATHIAAAIRARKDAAP